MVATRGRTFKRPWRRSCLTSKLKSSSAPITRKDSWCFHAVGSSNAPLLGSTAAEGLPRIGRTSIATRWRSCGLPQSASCSENSVIPPDVSGQTLRNLLVAARVHFADAAGEPRFSFTSLCNTDGQSQLAIPRQATKCRGYMSDQLDRVSIAEQRESAMVEHNANQDSPISDSLHPLFTPPRQHGDHRPCVDVR